jgi:hypothetical protein
MKRMIMVILIGAAGYFTYENFIKEKTVLEIKANKSVSTSYSMDIDAPALSPGKSGFVQGTVKNISDKVLTKIILKYKMNNEPTEASIDRLEPGEVKNFSTQSVALRHVEVSFFLEEMSYE